MGRRTSPVVQIRAIESGRRASARAHDAETNGAGETMPYLDTLCSIKEYSSAFVLLSFEYVFRFSMIFELRLVSGKISGTVRLAMYYRL